LISREVAPWAIRVQLKTHHLNLTSRRAIERLGAVKWGVLRNHMIMPDGFYRYSVYYSIIASVWPGVKEIFEAMRLRLPAEMIGTHESRKWVSHQVSRILRTPGCVRLSDARFGY
jgi:hypothetical protein